MIIVKKKNTSDFLDFIANENGPNCSVYDNVPKLIAQYAFDMHDNEIVNMKSKTFSRIMMAGFKNGFQKDVWVQKGKSKVFKTTEYNLFIKDSGLLKLSGTSRRPGDPKIILADDGQSKQLNSWIEPSWGYGEFDQNIVDVFIDFVSYLIPKKSDSRWFLDHLAMKAQNPKYRGAGVIMTTPVQGTGRGTLSSIIEKMWGSTNVATVSLSNLVAGAISDGNNSWITKDWIVVPEAKEATMEARTEARAYESLKSFIEPGASNVLVREKWKVDKNEACYGSVIICSQHNDALTTEIQDTRFKRIENTIVKKNASYFEDIWKWIENGFEKHVWRWLKQRNVDHFKAFSRQNEKCLKDRLQLIVDTGSPIDVCTAVILTFCEELLHGCVFVKLIINTLKRLNNEFRLSHINCWESIVAKELKAKTRAVLDENGKECRMRLLNGRYRLRHTIAENGNILTHKIKSNELDSILSSVDKKLTANNLNSFLNQFCQ